MKKIFTLAAILIFGVLCSCNSQSQTVMNNLDKKLDYSTLTDLDMPKDNINLNVDGHALNLKSPIYLEKNRYYLCLNDLIDNLNGTLSLDNKTLKINVLNKDISIDTEANKVSYDSQEYNLKEKLINEKKFYYISISDFARLMNFHTRWDVNSKTIYCKTDGDNLNDVKPYKSSIEQKGYLRIEDVALTTMPYDKDYLEKLRIIGNFLAKRNVPYHIAWIPRYVSPSNNVDVDPTARNDFQTAELVYTLDYITAHNGVIGLHGYTHQRDKEESAVGAEFGYKHPSVSQFEERMQKALDTAKYLDIPISFFEAPHYEITPEQNAAAEKYFNILYHPFKDNGEGNIDCTKPQVSPRNNKCFYISAYLDYVHNNGADAFINKVKNANTKNMGSMFFHPRLDFKNISLTDNNGIPEYSYNDNAILKRIINELEKKGYNMSSVTDIK